MATKKHSVLITFKSGGKVDTEVQGVKGPECENILSFMDVLDGLAVEEEGRTDDYNDKGDPERKQYREIRQQ